MINLHRSLEAGTYTKGSSQKAGPNGISNPPTNPAMKWKVRAGIFHFRMACDFAIDSYATKNEARNLAHDSKRKPKDTSPSAEADVFVFPMHNTVATKSDLMGFVANEYVASQTLMPDTHPEPLRHESSVNSRLSRQDQQFEVQPFSPSIVIKSAPEAFWSPYYPNLDPMTTCTAGLLAGNKTIPTVDLVMR